MVRVIKTLAIGAGGGAVFHWIGMPLPWMLGALFFTMLVAVSVGGLHLPRLLRDLFMPVLGVMVGSAFTPDVLGEISHWLGVIVTLLVYLGLAAPLGYLFFRRIGRFDRVSAYFSAIPGGMSEITFIGAALGADLRVLALIHSMRIIVIVFTVPTFFFLIGGLDGAASDNGAPALPIAPYDAVVLILCGVVGFVVGRWLRLPAAALVGPLGLSAIVHLTGVTAVAPPDWLMGVLQVVLGSAIGARFAGTRLREIRRFAALGLCWGAVMLLLALGFAYVGSLVSPVAMPALVLALAPGGLSEMVIVTLALGVDIALVSTCHLVRIALVYLSTPVIVRAMGWTSVVDRADQ